MDFSDTILMLGFNLLD